MKIQTTTTTQTGNEVLGTKEKTLYYLIVTNSKNEKITLHVGEKTHEGVKQLLLNEELNNQLNEVNQTKTKK